MMSYDVEPLAETLPLRPYETATSLLSRVAAKERSAHVRQFARDFYIDFNKVAKGQPHELRKVATLLSADIDDLVKWTPRVSETGFYLGGEDISNFRSRRIRLRVCPVCAAEDVAAAPDMPLDAAVSCRAYTLVDPVRTCFIHGCALVQVADSKSTGFHRYDSSLAIADALEGWDELRENIVMRPLTKLESYILGRLGFIERLKVDLADDLSVSELTAISQQLGLLILRGRSATLEGLSEDDLREIAETGFGVLLDGVEGVQRFVDLANDRAIADGAGGMASAIFGKFGYFLHTRVFATSFTRIKQIIVDRLSELFAYGPDEPPKYGVKPARRYWHSIVSAERQYGIPQRTIQKIAENAGLIESLNANLAKSRTRIDAAALDLLLTKENLPLSRWEVSTATGAIWQDFAAYDEAGLLSQIDGEVEHKHRATYRAGDVRRLEAMMLKHAISQDGEVEGMVSPYQAYLQTDWSQGEIVGHTAEGRVRSSVVTGLRSLEALRVDLTQLREMHPLHGVSTMGLAEAAAFLGVEKRAISRLINSGRLPTYRKRHPDHHKPRTVVPLDAVHDFRRRYMTISEIWQLGRDATGQTLASRMASNKIAPAFPFEDLRCKFYHRDQVEALISST